MLVLLPMQALKPVPQKERRVQLTLLQKAAQKPEPLLMQVLTLVHQRERQVL